MAREIKVVRSGAYSNEVRKFIKMSKKEKEDFQVQMEKYGQNFVQEHFKVDLTIPIVIDGRLTSSGGSFHYYYEEVGKREPITIKISERFVACALLDGKDGMEAILDVLKHELVHYALYVTNEEEYSDGDYLFEKTLADLDIGSSGATAEDKRLSRKKNIWYSIYDIYYNNILGKTYRQRHTATAKQWIGIRREYEIVKSSF